MAGAMTKKATKSKPLDAGSPPLLAPTVLADIVTSFCSFALVVGFDMTDITDGDA
jgi:hypothetical protein